jgi:hypothetical protein
VKLDTEDVVLSDARRDVGSVLEGARRLRIGRGIELVAVNKVKRRIFGEVVVQDRVALTSSSFHPLYALVIPGL